jgi:peroxiredoxin
MAEYVHVNITIEEKHQEFREDLNLNLSGILQDKLDEMIEQYGWESTKEILQNMDEEDKPEGLEMNV